MRVWCLKKCVQTIKLGSFPFPDRPPSGPPVVDERRHTLGGRRRFIAVKCTYWRTDLPP
jgi:hypothetical protein